jgi:hypothetical protein
LIIGDSISMPGSGYGPGLKAILSQPGLPHNDTTRGSLASCQHSGGKVCDGCVTIRRDMSRARCVIMRVITLSTHNQTYHVVDSRWTHARRFDWRSQGSNQAGPSTNGAACAKTWLPGTQKWDVITMCAGHLRSHLACTLFGSSPVGMFTAFAA